MMTYTVRMQWLGDMESSYHAQVFGGSETYVLALGNRTERDFDLGLSQNVGGGGHVDEEV